MDSSPTSALHIALQKGEWVSWNDKPHRFEFLMGDRARIREPQSDRLIEVDVAELRGLPAVSLEPSELDRRLENLRVVRPEAWSLAEQRESVILRTLYGVGSSKARVESAAASLGLSTRTIERMLARYRHTAQTTSLLRHSPGSRKDGRRLGAERERIVQDAIEKAYLVRPKPPMEEAFREVVRQCKRRHLQPPARNSVLRRIRALDARLVARRRLGAKGAQSIALSTPGALEVRSALELVQIDHTLADVMIVDAQHRRSIGRPWLTLAIDVATRCVLGFHVSLRAPSALSVALCLEHSVLPKCPPPSSPDISWCGLGIPQCIHVDNGREFHSEALRRGTREYGITLQHRPVATPRFGAHVERLIGTMMGRVHLLPGSTDSSPSQRSAYRSEEEARLTLSEFVDWLWLEIAGPYHHNEHRMLGTSPAAAWHASIETGVVPILPADPQRFVTAFLPVTHRKLQRNGLFFEKIRYWADILPSIAQPRESLVVRYDPRNLSKLRVMGPSGHYHEVPYADVRRPPISLDQLRVAHRTLREQGRARANINEEALFAVHERQKLILFLATTTTRRARRKAPLSATAKMPNLISLEGIDFTKDPVSLPSEIWEEGT